MGTSYKADVEQVDAHTPRLADGLVVPACVCAQETPLIGVGARFPERAKEGPCSWSHMLVSILFKPFGLGVRHDPKKAARSTFDPKLSVRLNVYGSSVFRNIG
jgi:hypothetical protein